MREGEELKESACFLRCFDDGTQSVPAQHDKYRFGSVILIRVANRTSFRVSA